MAVSAGRGGLRVNSDLERGAVATRSPRVLEDTPATPADKRAEAADAARTGGRRSGAAAVVQW